MQTFLPFADFAATAGVLDPLRLGKQRVEVLQVLRAATRPTYGWRHHPVTKMWRGWEEALGAYGTAICSEWSERGFADTCLVKIRQELDEMGSAPFGSRPSWIAWACCPHGWATSVSTGATAPPCSARTRSGTGGSSPTCLPICRTTGRR